MNRALTAPGALDFQRSPTEYVPRQAAQATLDDLHVATERIEQGLPLSPELDQTLNHGTSIGGARPKALVLDGEPKYEVFEQYRTLQKR